MSVLDRVADHLLVVGLRIRADLAKYARSSRRQPRRGTRIVLGTGIELHLGSNPVNLWLRLRRVECLGNLSAFEPEPEQVGRFSGISVV